MINRVVNSFKKTKHARQMSWFGLNGSQKQNKLSSFDLSPHLNRGDWLETTVTPNNPEAK
jgi:hypothetical protein